jgi:iron complex transport system permease protein
MKSVSITKSIIYIFIIFGIILFISCFIGLLFGTADISIKDFLLSLIRDDKPLSDEHYAIIWTLRMPRVFLSALVGAALALGGLNFQALLRNPLAEPYILGVSGGSAIGAIIGIIIGFSNFPGVGIFAFLGSMATLSAVMLASGKFLLKKETLILCGVMINSFCSAVIMFLISIAETSSLQNILFWLMGNFSLADIKQTQILSLMLIPCFILFFFLSNSMNLMLMGKEMAKTMGVNVRYVTITILVLSSFMVSATVCLAGLLGFVGLVIPHLLRIILGADHRKLVPACILGGASYMILCDMLARTIPENGEMPVGVITAIIGAPLFIILLRKQKI